MPEIDVRSALETNVLKLGTMTMEAHADRIIIIQDPFVSGYECTTCGGKMIVNDVSHVACDNCNGRGKYHKVVDANGSVTVWSEAEFKCAKCDGSGSVRCPACDGKGGTIIIPDKAENRPTTGTIVSVGPEVRHFERGQAVIYPSFAGYAYDLEAEKIGGGEVKVVIVILRESEVLAKVSGHLELRRVKKTAALSTAA